MDWYSIALMAAGVIGGSTAIVHGILMKRLIIRPIEAVFMADEQISASIQKIVRLLLHFTTFNWLISGLTLIAVAIWFNQDAKLVTGLFAGSSFLYGAIISFWVMHRPHPSWILFSVACLLIVLGLTPMA
ncbi:hypothetical protein BHU24_22250 [Bacillus pseudomycoides]|uniref:hypothetical protein n=1 Tax=Bacillus pseudomycoides TaxID=64104 RepID=UPI000BF802CA|nr:hypothetical protein [Bacillus pseudomycoides]MBD5797089.1 hypothetical protein [Bacillus pseudomycoides]MED1475696.1 hypothetical protein [Bacillus pseudomycoides]PEO77681.1 hypothetical protein CN571_29840 [Bacillus pseudomycoides]PHB18343.1 hypothetical protein COE85_18165 [Bacillus pseudomycoides]